MINVWDVIESYMFDEMSKCNRLNEKWIPVNRLLKKPNRARVLLVEEVREYLRWNTNPSVFNRVWNMVSGQLRIHVLDKLND